MIYFFKFDSTKLELYIGDHNENTQIEVCFCGSLQFCYTYIDI